MYALALKKNCELNLHTGINYYLKETQAVGIVKEGATEKAGVQTGMFQTEDAPCANSWARRAWDK